MPYKTMIKNLKDNQKLSLTNNGNIDMKSLAQALNGTEIKSLDLSNNNIVCNDLRYLTQVLRNTKITTLVLKNNNIMEEGVKYLAESLKGSQITTLDLGNNNIGCNGLHYLAQVLRETQITTLHIEKNNIWDEGVKHLAESLKETQITKLYLTENIIEIDAAQYLNKALSNTKMKTLYIDIYFIENGIVSKIISERSYNDKDEIHVTLWNKKIGMEGVQYLNEIFKINPNTGLEMHIQDLEADDAQYLAQAFKDTKISRLKLTCFNIMQRNGIQFLVQVFKNSQIGKLNLCDEKLRITGAQYLSEFLKQVKVFNLDLSRNDIGDEGMKYLAPVLANSDIMYINFAENDLNAEGARYLSEILKNSKILHIGLCNNSIGVDGARYLANGLPNSQVTDINLHGNMIQYAGYQHLIDVVDNTNLSWVNLHRNNIEALLEEGTKLWHYRIPRNNTPFQVKIRNVFKEVVGLNSITNELEFILPRKNSFFPADIGDYVFLFKTLKDNSNYKVQILDLMCNKRYNVFYDINVMNKINEFIAIMPNKFNTFIDCELPNIVELFSSYNYVNLVKQFEDMEIYDVVQNLLLHRVLYYVDEQQEILHPYIYKMLNKYKMPLYNKQLEPNKKEKIIAYYQSHQEIDGIHEIIDLLESESFK